ncbi:aspartic peptidase domain-containing protein [Lipomyces orientalis]|uniref:Aspartic peptidase domain-containing protein n=1 Tax=Lipomyces orientalis TaxID=1233043 RepID=A0ACC3TQB7_9ASCO
MRLSTYSTPFIALLLAADATCSVPGTVNFNIVREKRRVGAPNLFELRHRHRLRRRDSIANTVEVSLENQDYLYLADIQVGTPGQTLRVQIDTGSSDLWIQSGENQLCQEHSDPCGESGIFEPEDSESYVYKSNNFLIRYGDRTYARGDYAYESVTLGSATVTNMTIAVATDGNATEGVFGIGYPSNEAIISQYGPEYRYPNLPDLLVEQGLIQSRVYSLWLNDLDASNGNILFGGVDRKKFSGALAELPIAMYSGESEPSEFFVELLGLGFTDVDGSAHAAVTSLNTHVLLDSGTSFNYLPLDILEAIASIVNAKYSSNLEYYVQRCDVTSLEASIDFYFDGVTIKVPLNEILLPAISQSGEPLTFTDGAPVCILSVRPDSDIGVSILGDTFLRSAYVVYDLDNHVIGLGQTIYNQTESDVVAISGSLSDVNGQSSSATSTSSSSASLSSASSSGARPTTTDEISLTTLVTTTPSVFSSSDPRIVATSTSSAPAATSTGASSRTGIVHESVRNLLGVCVILTCAFVGDYWYM